MRSTLTLIFAATLSVGAIGASAPKVNEKALRDSFADKLKDSDSAKFKDIHQIPGDVAGLWIVCGDVNAKNSYGAYAGFVPFMAMATKEGKAPVSYIALGTGEAAAQLCASKMGK